MRSRPFHIGIIACIMCACTPSSLTFYADPSAPWSVTLESLNPGHKEITVDSDGAVPEIAKDGKSITHTYKRIGGKAVDLKFTFTPSMKGDAVEISASVVNDEKDFFVKKVTGPVYTDPSIDLNEKDVYLPEGVGMRLSGCPASGEDLDKYRDVGLWKWNKSKHRYEISAAYPSAFGASMQFVDIADADEGLYIASHDPEFRFKRFLIRYDVDSKEVSYGVEHLMTCFPTERYETPAATIYRHRGDWHTGADCYSAFFHSAREIHRSPEWLKHSSGWLLTILKQQNEEIIWPYNTIGHELCDVADQVGINVIGLFGWTIGGHDRFYPDYDPDPDMGGREVLKENIAEAHKRGKRIIIYANGQLIDQNGTRFWPDTGRFITVQEKSGGFWHQKWQKYWDCPVRIHGMACQSSPVWRQRLLNLAIQANDLGADGILYDQLATGGPNFCYGEGHGHRVPGITYEKDKYETLEYVRSYMDKVNPEFVIMTEGVSDAELNTISMYHSFADATFAIFAGQIKDMAEGSPAGANFPQLFKYTIPEWVATNRNPCPSNNRETLNYCVTYGLRSELECRYAPDREYMTKDRKPLPSDYDNMVWPADLTIVNTVDPAEMRVYNKQVLEFCEAHDDILWNGRFVDTKGFTIESDSRSLFSSAFVTEDGRMGVVVWNSSYTDAASYSVKADGYRLVETCSPDSDVKDGDPVPPQSIHLLIFKK